MNYLSVCSGIEAATVGWHSLGWQPVAFSEIEPFPCAALAHHYPDVPNWGDMTKFKEWPDANVDVLVGGTPCQSFSVAGLRKGLDDPRGNLMLTYLAIAAKYRPKWVVWENVPGVLSSNGGRDFASLLRGMAELGYGFAYRILDAQYFGVPQRRRRVFVVGCLGDWHRAAAVLFERHSLQGHPAPSREAGKRVAGGVNDGVVGSLCADTHPGGYSGQDAYTNRLVTGTLSARTNISRNNHECLTFRSPAIGNICQDNVASTITRNTGAGGETQNPAFVMQSTAYSMITANTGANGLGVAAEVAPTLDRAQPCAVAFAHQAGGTQTTLGYDPALGTAPTLSKCQTPAVAFDWKMGEKARSISINEEQSPTLGAQADRYAVQQSMQVRRLTPRECERLQGFKDDYTQVPYRNKPAADGPRYKALGNSMAVPVMAWIGKRIQQVEEISCTTKQKYPSA